MAVVTNCNMSSGVDSSDTKKTPVDKDDSETEETSSVTKKMVPNEKTEIALENASINAPAGIFGDEDVTITAETITSPFTTDAETQLIGEAIHLTSTLTASDEVVPRSSLEDGFTVVLDFPPGTPVDQISVLGIDHTISDALIYFSPSDFVIANGEVTIVTRYTDISLQVVISDDPAAVPDGFTPAVMFPPEPTGVVASDITATTMTLSWQVVTLSSGSIDGYYVAWEASSTAPADCTGTNKLTVSSGATKTADISGLAESTTYSARICSFNSFQK